MKILKTIFRLIILIAIVILGINVRLFLQKKGVIVMNSSETVITQLRAISKLETAEMTMTKNMSAEAKLNDYIEGYNFDNIIQELLFQDKMSFNLTGKVVAGIDLDKISTGDIITKLDGSVSIKLPEAEILYVDIVENEINDRQIGLLTKGNVNMETELRNQAKEQMKNEAIEAGILQAATDNAQNALQKLLGNFQVNVSWGESDYTL